MNNRPENLNPGESLLQVLSTPETFEFLSGLSEAALDQALADGVLKDIPIVSSIVGLGKVGLAIRDYFFIRKLHRFLFHLKKISGKSRDEQLRSLGENQSAKKRMAASLMLTIDRVDDLEKADYLAEAFSSFLREKIDLERLLRFMAIIDRAFLPDLRTWQKAEPKDGLPRTVWRHLETLGLIEGHGMPTYTREFEVTALGREFAESVLMPIGFGGLYAGQSRLEKALGLNPGSKADR